MNILLVEDDADIREALEWLLVKEGYQVGTADNGLDAVDMALSGMFDVAVLDWMLPKKDGIHVLQEIRSAGLKIPVLMLTAKTSVDNRVTGLDAGADDYLMKPFAKEELFARVRALARRRADIVAAEKQAYCDLVYEPAAASLSCGTEQAHLTQKENLLFELLIVNRGKVLSKELLYDRVWGLDSENDIGCVEIYVHYLRKKLTALGSKVSIATIRGAGYRLEDTGFAE